ncbi:MAG: hypothetical protein AB1435_00070 [Chloroflexota bacterium]
MSDETWLDEALAAYTDDLLDGRDVAQPPALDELAPLVRHLRDLAGPALRPESAFQEWLRQRLGVEWAMQAQQRGPRRVLGLVAGVALVLVIAALVTTAGDGAGDDLQGAALGSVTWVATAAVGLVGAVLIVWLSRRR